MRVLGVALWASLLLVIGGATGGCVAEVQSGRHCAGGYWVEGHHGPHGRWHPGHWRCPGVVEVVEID